MARSRGSAAAKQRRASRVVYALVVVSVLALFVSACGGGGSSPQSTGGDTLTVALHGDITSLDPAYAFDFTTNPVVNNVTEGLLRFNPDGTLAPNLAERWENPDALTYVYHLRQDVTFADGTPMTAEDVVFSLERHRDESLASYLAYMFANVDTIEAVDEHTVRVTLKQPDAFWQYVPATTGGHVVSKAYVESHPDFGRPEGGTMGTGPYKYVSWQVGSEIVLEKNENYWDKSGGPYFDRVVFKVLPDGTTRVAGLKTGEIDATIGGVPVDQLNIVEEMDHVRVVKVPGAMVNFVAFNNSRPPFDDINLRLAMAHAIDVAAVHQQIAGDASEPGAPTLVAPGLWGADHDVWAEAVAQLPRYEYDMEKAREYLARSNYPDGLETTIYTDNDPVRLNFALALASAVEPLGIKLNVEQVTFEEWVTYLLGGREYDLIMDQWGSDFPDPAGNLLPAFLSSNIGEGGSNQVRYTNPEVDELLERQNASTDPQERLELLLQVQELVAHDVPMIVVDYPYQIAAFKEDLSGYELSALWYWDAWIRDLQRN